MEARGQLVGLSSFCSPCGAWGSNPGPQVWQALLLSDTNLASPLGVFGRDGTQAEFCTVAQVGLEFLAVLPQPPKC